MATTAAITLEELARMPDDGFLHEIDAGELIVMTRPNSRHGALQVNIISMLNEHVRRNKLGRVFSESGFILGHNPEVLRGPDVAFVRTDRLKDVPDDGWAEMGPDLDAAEYFMKYPGRFFSMHLQDWNPETKTLVAVGKGGIDWKKVFTAAKTGGFKSYYIEQNMEMTKEGVDFLKTLKV